MAVGVTWSAGFCGLEKGNVLDSFRLDTPDAPSLVVRWALAHQELLGPAFRLILFLSDGDESQPMGRLEPWRPTLYFFLP
jgi:hypothetical protein